MSEKYRGTPLQCKGRVPNHTGFGYYQCTRKAVRDGFCKQHHPDTKAAVKQKRYERYKANKLDEWAYKDRAEAAEAKLRAVGELPRVRLEIIGSIACPIVDVRGQWVRANELEALLKEEWQ